MAGGRRPELHPRRTGLAQGLVHVEELLFFEPERRGHHVGWERLDPPVVILHVVVVEASGGLQPHFGLWKRDRDVREKVANHQGKERGCMR